MEQSANPYRHMTALLTAYFLIECIDEIEYEDKMTYWKQGFKQKVKMCREEMEKLCNEYIPKVTEGGTTGEQLVYIMRSQEQMIHQLARISPAEYPIIAKILELYKKCPDDVSNAVGIIREVN